MGIQRTGPIQHFMGHTGAAGTRDGVFGTITSSGFNPANAGTIPFIGGPGGLLARGALRMLANPSTRPLLTGTRLNTGFIRFGLGRSGGNGVIRFGFGNTGKHIDLIDLGRIPKGGF